MGDELVRFLNGAAGRVTYGLRVKSGEIEALSNHQAELIYEEFAKDNRRRDIETVIPRAAMTAVRTSLYQRSMRLGRMAFPNRT